MSNGGGNVALGELHRARQLAAQGQTGGDMYVMPAMGGEARNLTPGIKISFTTFSWTRPEAIDAIAWATEVQRVTRITKQWSSALTSINSVW